MDKEKLSEKLGINVLQIKPVSGGDINKSYCIVSDREKYFIKLNFSKNYPGLFKAEALGLKKLSVSNYLGIPTVLKTGEIGDQQYLLMEWIYTELNPKLYSNELLARGLAAIHQTHQENFGFESDNYIGTLKQFNNVHKSWADFYYGERLYPLLRIMVDKYNLEPSCFGMLEKLHKKINVLFPIEQPSLLHGDLWCGNVMGGKGGKPHIYDPAVYFGHREMDLGMMKLFGGFDNDVFEIYNELFPLENEWQFRIQLTQLYPIMVHAVLCGGIYVKEVLNTLTLFGK